VWRGLKSSVGWCFHWPKARCMNIEPGDFKDPRVVRLLKHHLETARAHTASGSAHALDVEGLQGNGIDFWTIWEGDHLLGCGALKALSSDHGEVKSMHPIEPRRKHGVGTLMLNHIIATARAKGMTRVSLETGSWPYFEQAVAFYRRHGFNECEPF